MNTIQVDGVGDAEHRSPKIEQATKLQIVRMKMSEQIEKQFSPHFRQVSLYYGCELVFWN